LKDGRREREGSRGGDDGCGEWSVGWKEERRKRGWRGVLKRQLVWRRSVVTTSLLSALSSSFLLPLLSLVPSPRLASHRLTLYSHHHRRHHHAAAQQIARMCSCTDKIKKSLQNDLWMPGPRLRLSLCS
jgi:hypothetical protein